MDNPHNPLPSRNNLGSKYNLNNARRLLTKRLVTLEQLLAHNYRMGFHVGRLNNQIYNTKNLLKEVNRRIRIRHENLQFRHFSRNNLQAILNLRKNRNPATHHLYIRALENLIKKYHITQPRVNRNRGELSWKLVEKMINENTTSRNQLGRNYGLHWEMKMIKRRSRPKKTRNQILQEYRNWVRNRAAKRRRIKM